MSDGAGGPEERRYDEALISERWDTGGSVAPHTRYALFAQMRTGSELVCADLRQRGIGVPHEYFQSKMMPRMAQRLGVLDADGTFDLVVSVLVLQHLPSQQAILAYLGEFVRVLRPGGALVVQLPSKVPPPPALPPWQTRDGVRRRVAPLLRRLGVSAAFLYRRLDWVPEMTMTAVPEAVIRETLVGAGGNIVWATPPDIDRGGTESRIFFVTR